MPPKKKADTKAEAPAKKSVKKKTTSKYAVQHTEEVAIRDLNFYHKNPNVNPDIDKIAKSLHINGLFRPVVVNIGTKTGRPMEILAGNHTVKAARKPLFFQQGGNTYDKPAWDAILASFVDVTDAEAAQIVLADNQLAKDGTINDSVVWELFQDMPEVSAMGAGFTQKDLDALADKFVVEELEAPDMGDLDMGGDDDDDAPVTAPPKFDDTDLGDEGEAEDDAPSVSSRAATKEEDEDDPEGAGVEITSADEEIKGAYDLKDSAYFDSVGYWQIPKLRGGKHLMQPEDLPEKFTTWAGSATKYEDDPDTWWLYNYGVDSTSGMKDISKVVVSFYTYDEYFEPWWYAPSRYTSKIINSGIQYILTPDFSDDTNAGRAACLHQLYRARWLGRYFQEAGLKVLPNISWPHGDIEYLRDYTLKTLPKDVRMIALQLQTYSDKISDEDKEHVKNEVQLVMDTIKPEVLILYSGQPGYEFFMDNIKYDGEVKFLLNRQAKLTVARKGRKRKDTI